MTKPETKALPEPTSEHMSKFLDLLLTEDAELMMGDISDKLKPFTCEFCPLEAKTREPDCEIDNDRAEAHYICPILEQDVWGEDPKCGPFAFKVLVKSLRLMKRALADNQQDSASCPTLKS